MFRVREVTEKGKNYKDLHVETLTAKQKITIQTLKFSILNLVYSEGDSKARLTPLEAFDDRRVSLRSFDLRALSQTLQLLDLILIDRMILLALITSN
jgi:hypothetical protein